MEKRQQVQESEYIFPYHYLDLWVDEYKLVRNIPYFSYLNIVKGFLTSGKVLDAGCGDGRFSFEIMSNLEVVGVDYSENAISFARAFCPGIKFFRKDLVDFDLNEEFDFIVFIETLEHIIPEKIPDLLKSLAKHLKKDGKLLITVPSKNIPLFDKHYQHFTKDSLARTLEPYFEIVELRGHIKKGFKRKYFNFLSNLGLLLIPFRNRVPFVKNYYSFLRNYFSKNLEKAKLNEAERLIAVCRKV